jgi:hypothetical protein
VNGFSKLEVIKDRESAVGYITKYTVKNGEVIPYIRQNKFNEKKLDNLPAWWLE